MWASVPLAACDSPWGVHHWQEGEGGCYETRTALGCWCFGTTSLGLDCFEAGCSGAIVCRKMKWGLQRGFALCVSFQS